MAVSKGHGNSNRGGYQQAAPLEVTVWSKDHDPRFSITMQIDLDNPLNDPRLAVDDAPFAARVDGYTRHGCARSAGHHAGRP
jgi:hypothetical protein